MVVVYRTYTRIPHQRPVWRKAHGDNIDKHRNQDHASTDHEDYAPVVDIDTAFEDQEEPKNDDMDAEPLSPPAYKPINKVYTQQFHITRSLINSVSEIQS